MTALERADAHADAVRRLEGSARDADGVAPFNDDTLLRLDERELLGSAATPDGAAFAAAALVRPADGALEAELAVLPSRRRRGLGRALVEALREHARSRAVDLVIWAHGDLPGARALAHAAGMRAVRTLRKLGRDVVEADAGWSADETPPGVRFEAFRPGADDGEFLALNASVFRDHPEQGRLDQAGLEARMSQPWFDASAFLIARDAVSGAMLGYNWLKLDDGEGEIYVIGVADAAAGRGVGRELLRAGLARIHAAGLPRTSLYVEGDNERALGLYRSLGYGEVAVDVQYRA